MPPTINNPVEGKVLVGSGTIVENDLDVRIYADQELFVGYNHLYFVLLKKGTNNKKALMFLLCP